MQRALLGSVDICIILKVCQHIYYLQSSGQRCLSSFGASRTCTLDRKPNASDSSEPSSGSPEPARNGGCSQPSTAGGTASTNGSPDGVNAVYGSECISISSMTPTWRTSSLTARSSGLIIPPQAHPKKRWASITSPWSKPRWVHYKGPRECGWPRQSLEV